MSHSKIQTDEEKLKYLHCTDDRKRTYFRSKTPLSTVSRIYHHSWSRHRSTGPAHRRHRHFISRGRDSEWSKISRVMQFCRTTSPKTQGDTKPQESF